MPTDMPKLSKLPTIRRLPAYLHELRQLQAQGQACVSGTFLAEQLKLDPVQVRKDLTVTGIVGKPRIGFAVDGLVSAIEQYLGWNNTTEALLVGAGHLGTALLGYSGFTRHGLNIVAAFDADPSKVHQEIYGKLVLPMEKLPDLAHRLKIHMGILCVPAEVAQDAADQLVAARITAIWNFTPTTIKVPAGIIVQNEDLSAGLAVLSAHVRKSRERDLA